MLNRKKIQQAVYLAMFLNSIMAMIITGLSMSTDYWVTARPYRHIFLDSTATSFQITPSTAQSNTTGVTPNSSITELADDGSEDNQDDFWPIDLYEKRDCKRYYGKIRFGLFKGVWVFNHAYGCKNRINRAYIIDMLNQHQLFDQSIWLTTILSLSIAVFCMAMNGLFAFVNVFISPVHTINGPIGMYLWNSLAGISYILALILFAVEFFVFINKNVLTKEEIESGWTSTNRARLAWSYYILFISLSLIFINIGLTYTTVRLRRSCAFLSTRQMSLGKFDRPGRSILVNCGQKPPPNPQQSPQLVSSSSVTAASCIKPLDYRRILGDSGLLPPQSPDNSNTDDTDIRYSRRLKRIIDFIY